MKSDLTCPVEVVSVAIQRENEDTKDNGQILCYIEFFNLSDKVIDSIQMNIICFDAEDTRLGGRLVRAGVHGEPRERFAGAFAPEHVDGVARVTGNPSNEALDKLRRGVYMEGDERRTYPAQVRVVRDESLFSDILVTIHEGRNRQVRRMFDSVGHKVLLLRRVRFGPLDLGDLRRGEWRELSAEEIAKLKAL